MKHTAFLTARLRRGSVPMEEKKVKRAGDVYREVKVGTVFAASSGPERSSLAPGIFGFTHFIHGREPLQQALLPCEPIVAPAQPPSLPSRHEPRGS
jgi:hypothetical protein